MTPVTVIGAGLAGCECAWQLAGRGIPVRLIEMKPKKMTPAHVSENFAELVCSNSLRSDELTNAVGLLKEELRRLDSVVLASADHNRVAAGGALDGDVRMRADALRDLARERLAVHGQRAPGGHGVPVRGGQQVRSQRIELGLEHAGRALGLGRLQRVRAHELGARAGGVHGRGRAGAHLHEAHAEAAVGKLERRLAPRKAGAEYGHVVRHACKDTKPRGS